VTEHPSEREAIVRKVPLGDLIGAQQRVLDAARALRLKRKAYVRARTSRANGLKLAETRMQYDHALDELITADEALAQLGGRVTHT
jgi:hypothetical protein